jgi:hypothetical protein
MANSIRNVRRRRSSGAEGSLGRISKNQSASTCRFDAEPSSFKISTEERTDACSVSPVTSACNFS